MTQDDTFELLRQMVAQGYNRAEQLKSDADFAGLHADPRFIELLSELEPPATCAALWRADMHFESKVLSSVPVDRLLEQLKPLIAQGCRPFAIAMDSTMNRLTPTPAAWAPSGRRDVVTTGESAHAVGDPVSVELRFGSYFEE